MASNHHGSDGEPMPHVMEALRRALENRRLDIGALGDYPNGRLSAGDEGALGFAVGADKKRGLVRIEFGTPVAWTAMDPDQAMHLAEMLMRAARDVADKPLTLRL